MPKEKSTLSDKVVERTTDKILNFIKEMADKQQEEKLERQEKHDELFADEKEAVRKEMKRVFNKIQKTDPESHEYWQLVTNYKTLMGIIDKEVY